MKIIDNRKDYYDYVDSKYGIDEDIVYDRRRKYEYWRIRKKVGNEVVDVWEKLDSYYGKSLTAGIETIYTDLSKAIQTGGGGNFIDRIANEERDRYEIRKIRSGKHSRKRSKKIKLSHDFIGLMVNLNITIGSTRYFVVCDRYIDETTKKLVIKELERKTYPREDYGDITIGVPIIIHNSFGDRICTNPILSGSIVVNLFSPEFIWEEVYSYLTKLKDPDIKDKRTNNEKIISAGFDTKTSFRNM